MNKILVATYTHKVKYYCIEDWLRNTKYLMDNYKNCDLLVVDNSDEKESPAWLRHKMDEVFGKNKQTMLWIDTIKKNSRFKQVESQRALWDFALNNGYDKLFIIESDVFPTDKLAIQKLDAADKPIVSGVYPLYTDPKDSSRDVLCIMGFGLNSEMKRFWYHRFLFDRAIRNVGDKSLIKIYACGLGCIMIKRDVLKTVVPEMADAKLAKELLKVLFKVDAMKTKSNKKKWLQSRIKKFILDEELMVKEKIHPDTTFYMHCELFNVNRYVLPAVQCEHRRQEWSEIEKVVPR